MEAASVGPHPGQQALGSLQLRADWDPALAVTGSSSQDPTQSSFFQKPLLTIKYNVNTQNHRDAWL